MRFPRAAGKIHGALQAFRVELGESSPACTISGIILPRFAFCRKSSKWMGLLHLVPHPHVPLGILFVVPSLHMAIAVGARVSGS